VTTASESKATSAAALRVLAADLESLTEKVEAGRRAAEEIRSVATEAKDETDSVQRGLLDLSKTVKRLADHVREIEDAALRAADEDPPEPRFHWLTASDPERAELELAYLVGWVGQVYLRFPGVDMPHCWMWHETVVAELHVLYSGWLDATDGKTGTAFKLMDWHDRYRPSSAERIKAELKECGAGREFEHHQGQGRWVYRPPHVPGTDLGGELAKWWATTQGKEPAPQLPPDMVETAKKETEERLRKQHKY
jgi:hypothetical protein